MAKDLYRHLKGTGKKIEPKDFVDSIFDLTDQYLKSHLTAKQSHKIARLRAYIEVNLKDL